ncbi:hypothetical protein F8280_24000 [Micromonospora noduli]|uniref:hypothetical protein n=1 Tax=Micromonospora noduli TaxID=709876 RepID=UPI000DC5114E|nr:hypothetical protein [Micromonospora noduli]KAB1920168.1 hypothetical protein F8280_24000 [Micromonospora noduli]RAO56253.1 hypothetical protein ONO86_00766 [Micromonospora noduli]
MTTTDPASRPDAEATGPSSAPCTIVAVAWPTGRPIHRYTAAQIADGVDLYSRALKARAAGTGHQGDDDAPE